MTTAKPEAAFAVWLTGLPASGKSTITDALVEALAARGVRAAVLESDELRRLMAATAGYGEEQRDAFYRTMAWIGALLTGHGVPVVFDATANLRQYRDQARETIERFVEVHVDTPIEVCIARDPKGIYRKGLAEASNTVPGLGADYESPPAPDLVVSGANEDAAQAARRIIDLLARKGYIA